MKKVRSKTKKGNDLEKAYVHITPLFSEGLSLKFDETLNTLWGVKEDPHGTPKSQRKRYFTENFNSKHFHTQV